MKGNLARGSRSTIESEEVQQALRALSFDGFTSRVGNTDQKNYAVFKPTQVKSVTGNLGEFQRVPGLRCQDWTESLT